MRCFERHTAYKYAAFKIGTTVSPLFSTYEIVALPVLLDGIKFEAPQLLHGFYFI
jgi:hypothetical protein